MNNNKNNANNEINSINNMKNNDNKIPSLKLAYTTNLTLTSLLDVNGHFDRSVHKMRSLLCRLLRNDDIVNPSLTGLYDDVIFRDIVI